VLRDELRGCWQGLKSRRCSMALRRCGVDHQSSLGLHYIGIDIVPDLVERLQARAARGRNQRRLSSR